MLIQSWEEAILFHFNFALFLFLSVLNTKEWRRITSFPNFNTLNSPSIELRFCILKYLVWELKQEIIKRMAASIKVFGLPSSTDVARVLACLFEKDVEFQFIRSDTYKKDHKAPEFLKLQVSKSLSS